MLYERLRIFISSSMQELGPERIAIKTALSQLNLEGWIFDHLVGDGVLLERQALGGAKRRRSCSV